MKPPPLDFRQFFLDVYGIAPLPWQTRLAAQLIETHTWPDLIDLPTASGKTACIDIALFHLAWCAELKEPWRAARRIVFVVDRRIIVDAAAERAERIMAALKASGTDTMSRVEEALRGLGGTASLICQKLRGGMPRERGLAFDPTQPTVVTSTVDQVGSRLLFRGYGLSPYSQPVHAGLLGHDTLLLVDEAHLSTPFIDTVAAIKREQSRAECPLTPIQPIRTVTLSATAKTSGMKFQLDSDDFAHPVIRQRRTAPKSARLVEASNRPAERTKVLLQEALTVYRSLDTASPVVALIVNRVKTARALYDALTRITADSFDVELLIGRGRPIDKDLVAERVSRRAGANRTDQGATRGLIVVATQTIEVGADLDFHGLVTECAALSALRQRFGRLDRLGGFRRSESRIVGGGEDDADPIYGASLAGTWAWLNSVAIEVEGSKIVDFSIESMEQLLDGVDAGPLSGRAVEKLQLTSIHADLLCQTSLPPMYDPDTEALLHGLQSGPPDIQLIWRADLPVSGRDNDLSLDSRELDAAQRLLELNPPTSLESLALPLTVARAWLNSRDDSSALSDVEGDQVESDEEKESTPKPRQALRFHRIRGWESVFGRRLQAGDTIVVPSGYGGCDRYGFDPKSTAPVVDLSFVAREKLQKSPQLIFTRTRLAPLANTAAAVEDKFWDRLIDANSAQQPASELLQILLEAVDDDFLTGHKWLVEAPLIDVLSASNGELYAIVVTASAVRPADISDEDLSSSRTVPVLLSQHNSGVGTKAGCISSALKLPNAFIEDLSAAGNLHDVGKADPRFQRMLRGSDERHFPGELLAKGVRSAGAGRVELGERHEAYSVALIGAHPELLEKCHDPALVRYLIGVHHGRGRPLMPDPDDEGTEFTVQIDSGNYAFDGAPKLGRLGSGWPTLFWRLNRKYGAWGLAYLEAILRLSDWMRSVEELKPENRS